MHRNVFLSVLAALGLVVGTVLAPVAMPVAHASPCGVLIKGSDWLQGQGVDVKGNCITPHGYDFYNYDVQCVELPQMRIYGPKGKFGWPAIYGLDDKAARIPEGSPGLIRYNPGSGYVPVPGDLIIEHEHRVNANYGHVAVVDRVEGNNIYAVEQNGSVNGWHTYYYNGSQYKGGYAPVKAILHAPQNHFTNGHDPEGAVDAVEQVEPGKIRVAGWVHDQDDDNRSLDVHVYVGGNAGTQGAEGHRIVADHVREDRANHRWGFNAVLDTHKIGNQEVCVYGINIGGGNNSLIGCRNTRIFEADPEGGLNSIEATPGHVKIKGWAWDNSDRKKQVPIHVYIGGEAGDPNAEGKNMGLTNIPDQHLNEIGVVGDHGFEWTIPTDKRGDTNVCVYALNIGHGYGNPKLGCKVVNIPEDSPVGGLDYVESTTPGNVLVRGWAHDESDRSQYTDIDVWVGGKEDESGAEGPHSITANKMAPSGVQDLFEEMIRTDKTGTQDVCAYAKNIGTGNDSFLGCRSATIAPAPKPAPVKPKPAPVKPTSRPKPTPAKPAKPAKPTTKKPTPAKPTTKKPTNPAPAPAPAPAPSGKESGSSSGIMWIVLLLVAVLGAAGAALQNLPGGLPGMPKV